MTDPEVTPTAAAGMSGSAKESGTVTGASASESGLGGPGAPTGDAVPAEIPGESRWHEA